MDSMGAAMGYALLRAWHAVLLKLLREIYRKRPKGKTLHLVTNPRRPTGS